MREFEGAVEFEGIDSWNRPVFKAVNKTGTRWYRYGAVDVLFDKGATENEVLAKVTTADLTYFGFTFGCEPMGESCNVEIVKS